MQYTAVIKREGRFTLASFPDCPGCQTFVVGEGDIRAAAQEALEGWLEAQLTVRRTPPRPVFRGLAPKGSVLWLVEVPPKLAVKISLRAARDAAGLSQAELADRAGVSQSAIAQLENPDSNPSIDTLGKVASALGTRLEIDIPRLVIINPTVLRDARDRELADRVIFTETGPYVETIDTSASPRLNLSGFSPGEPLLRTDIARRHAFAEQKIVHGYQVSAQYKLAAGTQIVISTQKKGGRYCWIDRGAPMVKSRRGRSAESLKATRLNE